MKQRSITRPPDITLFTDEDTGCLPHHRLPKILIDAGLRVECFEMHFTREGDPVEDHEWLSLCGKNGWVAVTHDKRIRLALPPVSKQFIPLTHPMVDACGSVGRPVP